MTRSRRSIFRCGTSSSQDVYDTPNFNLRKLTDGESVSAGQPLNPVTLAENHDMGVMRS